MKALFLAKQWHFYLNCQKTIRVRKYTIRVDMTLKPVWKTNISDINKKLTLKGKWDWHLFGSSVTFSDLAVTTNLNFLWLTKTKQHLIVNWKNIVSIMTLNKNAVQPLQRALVNSIDLQQDVEDQCTQQVRKEVMEKFKQILCPLNICIKTKLFLSRCLL